MSIFTMVEQLVNSFATLVSSNKTLEIEKTAGKSPEGHLEVKAAGDLKFFLLKVKEKEMIVT